MRKKYFFFDIDGTLTSVIRHGFVPENTRKALLKLKKAGHFVAIATGRPFYFANDIANDLAIDYLVCNGGNDLYVKETCIRHEPHDRNLILQAIMECMQHDIGFCVSTDNTIRRLSHNRRFLDSIGKTMFRGDLQIEENLDYTQIEQFERIFIAVTKNQEATLSIFKEQPPIRYQDAYVIVEPDDKFRGISLLMKHMQAPLEDVIVFGDGRNDIKMFQQAPYAIAMGNAIDPLKKLADYVTTSSDEDGITHALTYFHWI